MYNYYRARVCKAILDNRGDLLFYMAALFFSSPSGPGPAKIEWTTADRCGPTQQPASFDRGASAGPVSDGVGALVLCAGPVSSG